MENLLQILTDCVSKHIGDDVLSACSLCFASLCDESSTIYNKSNLKRSILIDSLIHNFKTSMNMFNERSEVDLDELYPLINSLKRLSIFSTNHDIHQKTDECWSIVYSLLKSATENDDITHEIVNYCFNLARNLLCWHLCKLDTIKEQMDNDLGGGESEAVTGAGTVTEQFNETLEQIKSLVRNIIKL